MKCEKCGFEQELAFEICPQCDEVVSADAVSMVELSSIESDSNTSVERIKKALKSPMYLAFCILFTIGCGLSIVGGGLSVIQVLTAIFLWIVFAESRKGLINHKNLRCMSGIVYAEYAINNIVGIILVICGAIISVAMVFIVAIPNLSNLLVEITDEINALLFNLSVKFTGAMGIIGGLLILLVGVVWLLLNNLATKKIHRFVKSIHKCAIGKEAEFSNPNAVKNWLIVFGVCLALYAIGTILGNVALGVATLYEAASVIIAAIIIDKYFMPQTQYV